MPKFLVHGNYVGEGIKALMKDGGSGRREVIEKLVSGAGGTVEQLYFAFGATDLFVIADLPDLETAAAVSLTANATGQVHVTLTVLLTPEELDVAGRQATGYEAPRFD